MTVEIEQLRTALRGKRLPPLATALGVPIPVLEAFLCAGAHLTPSLMTALSKLLATPPIKNIPAPVPRRPDMKLAARALKVSAVLDAAGLVDPGNKSRVTMAILVDGKTYTADVAAKSVRKCRATLAEHGADNVALMVQGKLAGDTIAEAGLVAQVKVPK